MPGASERSWESDECPLLPVSFSSQKVRSLSRHCKHQTLWKQWEVWISCAVQGFGYFKYSIKDSRLNLGASQREVARHVWGPRELLFAEGRLGCPAHYLEIYCEEQLLETSMLWTACIHSCLTLMWPQSEALSLVQKTSLCFLLD